MVVKEKTIDRAGGLQRRFSNIRIIGYLKPPARPQWAAEGDIGKRLNKLVKWVPRRLEPVPKVYFLVYMIFRMFWFSLRIEERGKDKRGGIFILRRCCYSYYV